MVQVRNLFRSRLYTSRPVIRANKTSRVRVMPFSCIIFREDVFSAPLIEANAKVWSIDQVLICQNEDEKNVGINEPMVYCKGKKREIEE